MKICFVFLLYYWCLKKETDLFLWKSEKCFFWKRNVKFGFACKCELKIWIRAIYIILLLYYIVVLKFFCYIYICIYIYIYIKYIIFLQQFYPEIVNRQWLIDLEIDNGIPCLGTSNLSAQINQGNKKDSKTNTNS